MKDATVESLFATLCHSCDYLRHSGPAFPVASVH